MVKENNKLSKAIVALSGAALLVAGGLAGGLIGMNSVEPVEIEKIVTVVEQVEVPVEVIKVVEKEVQVETIVEVEDTAFKELACNKLLYDDVVECVEEVTAEDKALQLALNYIEVEFKEISEELEDKDLVYKARHTDLVTVYDSASDVVVLESNFRGNKYEFQIEIKVNDDKDKKSFDLTLRVEDGKVEILDIE
jgi:hypothetical protein